MYTWLTVILFGLVQGIAEWLPVSSTGHMILLEALLPLDCSPAFADLFRVVIQLGSILAVLVLYAPRLDPRQPDARRLWKYVFLAATPAAVAGLLFDDFFTAHLFNPPTVAAALIVYGLLFIWVERRPSAGTISLPLSAGRAVGIGLGQMLALVPGTSRSGATILSGLMLGLDRTTAAEFSFFLALPTMLGASLLKGGKFALALAAGEAACSVREWGMLALASAVAFAVSLCAIRFLLDFVKRRSFTAFGIYRIALGCIVFAAYALGGIA